jgi:hypothetical protein
MPVFREIKVVCEFTDGSRAWMVEIDTSADLQSEVLPDLAEELPIGVATGWDLGYGPGSTLNEPSLLLTPNRRRS